MATADALTANVSLRDISVANAREDYLRRGLDRWSDRHLAVAVAEVVSRPKQAPADSFVLHAPLELLARIGLLSHVRPSHRASARQRLVWLAAEFAAAGDSVPDPSEVEAQSVDAAAAALVAAISAGDLDDVDRLSYWLGDRATSVELRRVLAEAVAPSLAAAGHAPILLYLLPRIAPGGEIPGRILRGPARELARHPDWRLGWFEAAAAAAAGRPAVSVRSLEEALLDVPVLGISGSTFIFPIMNQAEESGVAESLLSDVVAGEVDVRAARRALTRVAAWSMLQEPPEHAPYGWTHCLTMPQAVMGAAPDAVSARTALAVAATYVVGLRAALGTRALVADYRPERLESCDMSEALGAGPSVAAAAVWHAPDAALDGIVTELATRASLHHDAHFVKYTLACLDAAGDDPDERRLYLAAAASLAGWWADQPDDGFFA